MYDIYLSALCYLSTRTIVFYKNDIIDMLQFQLLEEHICRYRNDGIIRMIGDFRARTKIKDCFI